MEGQVKGSSGGAEISLNAFNVPPGSVSVRAGGQILKEGIDFLNEIGVMHLLIDMPSIDKENDEGKLIAHHAFWNYPNNPQLHKTITEFIYVPNEVYDGTYILNIQIAPFENDASPSKPVLYRVM